MQHFHELKGNFAIILFHIAISNNVENLSTSQAINTREYLEKARDLFSNAINFSLQMHTITMTSTNSDDSKMSEPLPTFKNNINKNNQIRSTYLYTFSCYLGRILGLLDDFDDVISANLSNQSNNSSENDDNNHFQGNFDGSRDRLKEKKHFVSQMKSYFNISGDVRALVELLKGGFLKTRIDILGCCENILAIDPVNELALMHLHRLYGDKFIKKRDLQKYLQNAQQYPMAITETTQQLLASCLNTHTIPNIK